MEKQVNLYGKDFDTASLNRQQEEELSLQKSALQKYIRRGNIENAMYWAWKMSIKETGWSLWRRLNIIAVEDALDPTAILAVSELGRQASKYGYDSSDGKRCAVAAAKILAEAQKDRSADEFLEIMDYCSKHQDDEDCKAKITELSELDTFVFDIHTPQGRKMGRGNKYWYEESSKVTNPSPKYIRFNDFIRKKMEEEKE